jgi:hypothetical protein
MVVRHRIIRGHYLSIKGTVSVRGQRSVGLIVGGRKEPKWGIVRQYIGGRAEGRKFVDRGR